VTAIGPTLVVTVWQRAVNPTHAVRLHDLSLAQKLLGHMPHAGILR